MALFEEVSILNSPANVEGRKKILGEAIIRPFDGNYTALWLYYIRMAIGSKVKLRWHKIDEIVVFVNWILSYD